MKDGAAEVPSTEDRAAAARASADGGGSHGGPRQAGTTGGGAGPLSLARIAHIGLRLLTLVTILALTVWMTGFGLYASPQVLAPMMLGFTLLAAYIAGSLAASLGLPRVTGYVLVGIWVGPFALNVLSSEMVDSLRTIDELALALIALTAGGELKLAEIRKMAGEIVGIGLAVLVVVLVGIVILVLAARPLVPLLADQPIEFALAVALLLGIWCANSSPDATIAVINETGARGPVTEVILGVTVFKDVLVIIGFAAALSIAGPLVQPEASFDAALMGTVAWEVGGALVIGALAGWGFAFYLERVGARSVLATLVFTFILTLLAAELHVELLLLAIAAGFVTENFSPAGDALIDAIEANAIVVFALFFALAGAALDLGALRLFWPMALVIVVVRLGLTWAGAWAASRVVKPSPEVRKLTWMGLVSQAGVTLGLSLLVGRTFPEWGDTFVAVTAAVIIFHLLLGPILLKVALTRAGEVRGVGAWRKSAAPSGSGP